MLRGKNGYYRAYFKHKMALRDTFYDMVRVLSFTIKVDALSDANTTFFLERVPKAVVEGDVIILTDETGLQVYIGMVRSVNIQDVDCIQITSLFNDTVRTTSNYINSNAGRVAAAVLYQYGGDYTHDSQIIVKTNDTMINQFMSQFTIQYDNSVTLFNLYEKTDYNLETLFMDMFKSTGSLINIDIPLGVGVPKISFGKVVTTRKLKLIDNTHIIPIMNPIVEVSDINKLIVLNSDETSVRAIRYLTGNGVTSNPSDLTRLQVVKTKYVATDDSIENVISTEIPKELFNHKIEVTMNLDNSLYDFFSFKIGQTFDVFIVGDYYDTVLTGYELSKELDENLKEVKMVFGMVRTKASQRFF